MAVALEAAIPPATAAQIGAWVESLAREIDASQASQQIKEMLALLLRPAGIANAVIKATNGYRICGMAPNTPRYARLEVAIDKSSAPIPTGFTSYR